MSDVYDRANEAEEGSGFGPSQHWGKISLELWECALEKGTGRVPFDPAVHKNSNVAIDLFIDLLPEEGSLPLYLSERHLVQFEEEWYGYTKPSALQCEGAVGHIRELPNKWCRYRLEPTKTTYTNKKGKERQKLAIVFEKFFPSEQACRDDYLKASISGQQTQTASAPASTASASNGKEKATALAFLKVIVQNACRGQTDLEIVRHTLAANLPGFPVVAKFFNVDSPDTMNLIMQEMGK